MPVAELLRMGTAQPIIRWGSPVLHMPARPVTDFGGELQALLADMFATNTAADGAGLAAQQIGVDLAVFIYDCADESGKRPASSVIRSSSSPRAGGVGSSTTARGASRFPAPTPM